MSRFENKLCPVCRSPFTENADIIVCPECGTPHHRTCYLALKHCALEERHAEGFVWRGALPDETPREPELPPADPHHAPYPEGTPQAAAADSSEVYGQSAEEFMQNYRHTLENDEQGEDGVSMRELIAYAASSEIHYGMAFEVFRNKIGGKRRVVFVNICSGIFAPVFQFYRKMDWLGAGALALMILTSLPGIMDYSGLIDLSQNESQSFYLFYMLCNFLSFAQTVVLCLFGDYLYYRHAVKRIKKIRGGFGDARGEEYFEALRESGKPSWLRAVIGLLLTTFVTACVTVLFMRG